MTDQGHMGTPNYVFEYAKKRWGLFDIDLCASEWNAKCPIYIDEQTNFLTCPKSKLSYMKAWINPPWQQYPGIGQFANRCIELIDEKGIETIVMHLPTRTGQQWFEELWMHCREVCFVQGRIKYEPPPGEPKGPGGFEDSMFVVLGDRMFGSPVVSYVKRNFMQSMYRDAET